MGITPCKAIKNYCLQCGDDSYKEVRLCPAKDCPLYPFRFGNNPNRKKAEDENENGF